MSFDITKSLLEAPCRWCGYNGQGYWQKDTHNKHCIWHDVGGADKREAKLSEFGRIKQPEASIPISKIRELREKYAVIEHLNVFTVDKDLQNLIDEAKNG